MKRGFTLVELSIVLVIIGLLIGGILVGQSLINSAQLQAVIRQVSQYDGAAMNFKTKYKSLPGDSKSFSPAGDGDGSIYSSQHLLDGGSGSMKETLNFWMHQSQAGMLAQTFKGNATYNSFSGDWTGFSPHLNYGKSCYLNAVTVPAQDYYAGGSTWVISSVTTSIYGPNYDDCLTPMEAFTLDAKIDDGNPKGGNLQVNYEYHGPVIQGMGPYCTANATNQPYDIKGDWQNSFSNIQANPKTPDKIGCTVSLKAGW